MQISVLEIYNENVYDLLSHGEREALSIKLNEKGELKAKVAFEVYHATAGAIAAVEKAGGSVKLLKPAEKATEAK